MDPDAAFPDENKKPTAKDLATALGGADRPLSRIRDGLGAAHSGIVFQWSFSPRAGWHLICSLKKRRLYYLVPTRGNFRLSLILGGKAIAALQAGPFARAMPALLKAAKRYPEGTAFTFDRATLQVATVLALLDAKIAP